MASRLNLETFIQGETGIGQFQSHGEFTVSLAQAKDKLSRYSLPFEGAWICKLLQAVVAWRAPKLEVTQERFQTIFRFQPSMQFSLTNGSDILQTFLSLNVGGTRAIERFCLALHSLRSQESLSFLLAVKDLNSRPVFFNDGPHYPDDSQGKALLAPFRGAPGVAFAVSHMKEEDKKVLGFWRPSSAVSKMTSIAEMIQASSESIPIPIHLDRRQILAFGDPDTARKQCLGVFSLKAKTGLGDPVEIPGALGPLISQRGPMSTLWDRKAKLHGFALFRVLPNPAPSKFIWVDDGIVVEQKNVSKPDLLQLNVYVNCTGLPTDLTGMKLVESGARKRRFREAQEALGERVESFCSKASAMYREEVDYLGQGKEVWVEEVTAELRRLRSAMQSVTWLGTTP